MHQTEEQDCVVQLALYQSGNDNIADHNMKPNFSNGGSYEPKEGEIVGEEDYCHAPSRG